MHISKVTRVHVWTGRRGCGWNGNAQVKMLCSRGHRETPPLTCGGSSCQRFETKPWTINGCAHTDSAGCCCHRRGERGREHASARGKVWCSRQNLSGHLPRLPAKLPQSRPQTSAVSTLLLQEMSAHTFKKPGHRRAAELPGWQRHQTTWANCLQAREHL